MPKFRPKAEVMFEMKMKAAVAERNFDRVAELFHQFGCYLDLVEPMPKPMTKALVHVPRDEPTVHEEQMYVLSGGLAEFSERLKEMVRYENEQIVTNLGMPQVRPMHGDEDALYQPVFDTSKFPHYQPFVDKYTL